MLTERALNFLVIEDNPLSNQLICTQLRDLGHAVIGQAHTGPKAVEMTARLKPDVVLMDLQMTDPQTEKEEATAGIKAARKIQAQCPTPIVVLTAYESPDLIQQASAAGIGAYLIKPPNPQDIERAALIARARFDDLQQLHHLNETLQNEIAERKQIEQKLSEEEQALHQALAEARRNARKTRLLLAASQAVLESHTFQEAARRIFDIACEATGAVSGYVAMMSEDGQENEVLFLESGGLPCEVDPNLPMPIRGLRAQAYVKVEAIYENDFMESEWVQFMPPGHVTMRNVMFAPIILGKRAVGVMGLANKPADFTEEDAKIAKALGDMTAIALRRMQAEDALRESEARYRTLADHLEHMVEEKLHELEEQRAKIVQMDKMAALGQMATGVAHELNQPLTAITFEADYLHMLARKIETEPAAGTDLMAPDTLQNIGANLTGDVERCRRIVDHLRNFGRVSQGPLTPISLDDPISNSLILTAARLREHKIDVHLSLADDLPPILADPHKLEQIFLNLIANAEYAMEIKWQAMVDESGKLPSAQPRGRLEIATYVEDAWVVAEIRDNGCGMSEEVRKNLFTPFYTTKPEGKGTGLGLSISQDIVQEFNGEITCESVESAGTTFRLRFPIAKT